MKLLYDRNDLAHAKKLKDDRFCQPLAMSPLLAKTEYRIQSYPMECI